MFVLWIHYWSGLLWSGQDFSFTLEIKPSSFWPGPHWHARHVQKKHLQTWNLYLWLLLCYCWFCHSTVSLASSFVRVIGLCLMAVLDMSIEHLHQYKYFKCLNSRCLFMAIGENSVVEGKCCNGGRGLCKWHADCRRHGGHPAATLDCAPLQPYVYLLQHHSSHNVYKHYITNNILFFRCCI